MVKEISIVILMINLVVNIVDFGVYINDMILKNILKIKRKKSGKKYIVIFRERI